MLCLQWATNTMMVSFLDNELAKVVNEYDAGKNVINSSISGMAGDDNGDDNRTQTRQNWCY